MTDQFIFEIMDKFNNSEIVDLDLSHSNEHISLKKKAACVPGINVPTAAAVPVQIPAPEPVEVRKEATAAENNNSEKQETKTSEKAPVASEVLKCPIVGTFYRAPSPDSPAYAEKGTIIKKGDPVCIIEAMKMMNTLNADYDFEVLDILVENGQLVEFDQPMFSIKKL